jgi:hypothetical protein
MFLHQRRRKKEKLTEGWNYIRNEELYIYRLAVHREVFM